MKLSSILSPALLSFSLVALAGSASAQITKAQPSPHAKITQAVGLSSVTLDYSRPGVKGRTVFGEMLPYGTVWRAGANACTTIAFDRNVQVGGKDVPKGTYSLFTIPNKDNWTFILNKNTELWGAGGYDPAEDLLRVEAPIKSLNDVHETLTIDFANHHANGADLVITWDKTKMTVPIYIDSDKMVFQEIDEKVINAKGKVEARTYFDAAMFYIEKNKDLKLASTWMDKAVEMSPDAFWMMYNQGSLAHTMGDTKKAMSCTQKALEVAKASPRGDFGYIAKCEALLGQIAGKEPVGK